MDETRKSATSTAGRPRSTPRSTTTSPAGSPSAGTRGTETPGQTGDTVGDVGIRSAATTGDDRSGSPRGVIDRVKEGATARLAAQKDRATEGLGTVAEAVRRSTEVLRTENHETAARFVERAAEQLQNVSTRLRQKDIGEILDDAGRLARRQPAIFIGLSFAAGLLTARFLKSSQERADRERGFGGRTAGGAERLASAGGYSG
jgi:hypothetical protein